MTPTEFASEIGRSYNTVIGWLRKGLIPKAVPQNLGNETRWFIPKERVTDFAQWDPKARWGKRGPGKKATKKATTVKRSKKGGAAK